MKQPETLEDYIEELGGDPLKGSGFESEAPENPLTTDQNSAQEGVTE